MNLFEDKILNPEEEFGGFDADNKDIFLLNTNESITNLTADNSTLQVNSVDKTYPEKKTDKQPKVKSISPPRYIPKKKETRKKSSFPAFAAVFSVVLILSLFIFVYFRKLDSFTILKNTYPPQYIYGKEIGTLIVDDELITESEQELNTTIKENESFVTTETHEQQTVYPQEKPKKEELKKSRILISSNDVRNKGLTNTEDMSKAGRIESYSINDNIKQSSKQENNQPGLFTVEVYSSSSYEDAKQWMNKLNRRNLQANIVPLKIRDEIVYKVRFGNFSTFNEASNSAMNFGFTRFYIDRIR